MQGCFQPPAAQLATCRLHAQQGRCRCRLQPEVSIALPNAARIVLATCDDGVALVVECAAEHFIRVPLQALQAIARLCLPQQGRLVAAGGEYFGALRVERHLGDLAFVPNQDGAAVAVVRIVQARGAVR